MLSTGRSPDAHEVGELSALALPSPRMASGVSSDVRMTGASCSPDSAWGRLRHLPSAPREDHSTQWPARSFGLKFNHGHEMGVRIFPECPLELASDPGDEFREIGIALDRNESAADLPPLVFQGKPCGGKGRRRKRGSKEPGESARDPDQFLNSIFQRVELHGSSWFLRAIHLLSEGEAGKERASGNNSRRRTCPEAHTLHIDSCDSSGDLTRGPRREKIELLLPAFGAPGLIGSSVAFVPQNRLCRSAPLPVKRCILNHF